MVLLYVLCRYDNSTKEGSFSIGLQGVKADDVDAVKSLIWDTLHKVSRYNSILYM